MARPATQPSTAPASKPAAADELAELERALAADRSDTGRRSAEEKQSSGLVRFFQDMNPDLSFIADVALAYFSQEKPFSAGGHDPAGNGFTLQGLELAVSGAVDPYFRFNANLVFSQFGVEIEEVYATTLALPWSLQVRVGQLLTRFGRINATHPHQWVFSDQVLVLGKLFGGEGNRVLGGELSVLLPIPWYVELSACMSNATGEATARSFYGGSDSGIEGMQDFLYTVAGKQFFPLGDDLSLMWGLSAAFGPNPTGRNNRSEIYGTDLYLKYRPVSQGSYTVVSLEAEWLLRRRQVPRSVLQDHGLYATLFYRFARRWAVAGRYEVVSGVADDPLDPEWSGLRQRASGNLTLWPTEFSRLRLQYDYDRPSWRAGQHAVLLNFEFAVGAHGAHTF